MARRGRMNLGRGIFAAVLAMAAAEPALADDAADIRAALTAWASDFNAGHVDKVCTLYAPDLIADIQGAAPARNYADQCATLQRALRDQSKKFTYSPTIHEVIVSGDVALVRLDWRLDVTLAGNASDVTSTEPGMDFFRRQRDGSWKIARFMTYEAN